jgi:DNA invertase Pin-like site-specific DNA recombinase
VYGIGLVRVSGDKQAEEGLSLDTQPDDLRAYCRRARILLLKVYEEPAVRGWRERDQRPEYAKALAHALRLAHEGKRVVFVVTYVDRLGRNHVEQSRALMELEAADVRVHTAVEFGGGPLDEDIGGLATWLAERNNRQQGMKVGGVWARARGRGWAFVGRKLWGYDHRDRTPEEQAAGAPEKVRIPHAVEAPFARQALERLAAGESAAAVHRWVAALPASARGGRVLAYTTFITVMQSPAYVGRPPAAEGRPRTGGRYAKRLWRRDDAPKLPETPEQLLALPPGRWEPLVSDESWLKAQQTLSSRRRPRGRPATNGRYKLTGLVRCPQCGSRMVGRPATGHMTFRYVCTAWLQKTVDVAPGPDGKICRFSCSGPSLEAAALRELADLSGRLLPDDPAARVAVVSAYEELRHRPPEEDAAVVVVREALARNRREERGVHERLAGYVDLLLKKEISQTAYDAAQAKAQTELDRCQAEERRLKVELARLTGGPAEGQPEVVLPPWEEVEAILPRTAGDWGALLERAGPSRSGTSRLALLVETVIPQRKSYGVYGAEFRWTRLGEALRLVGETVTGVAA